MVVPDILIAFLFSVVYGWGENRLFWEGTLEPKQQLDGKIFEHHFKIYHVCMFILFALAGFSPSVKTWIFNLLMMPLVEDASWFVFEGRMPKPNDWTCWPFYKLILGLPWWYWLIGIILAIMASTKC